MESFLQKLMEAPPPPTPVMVDPQISNRFTLSAFSNNLQHIDAMDERDLFNFIKTNINFIFKSVFENNREFLNALSNTKFLKGILQVIKTIPIREDIQRMINKICYDYLTVNDGNESDTVMINKQILLQMSQVVNSNQVQNLMALGLDMETANNLALARYSSLTERINVRRLNFVICCKDPDIMTTQMIVYIYEKLFDSVTELFMGTMLEFYVPSDDTDESFMEIYSTISLAVLTIVNNMTTNDIITILTAYHKDWEYGGKPRTRVSLRTLSADFGRIQFAVEVLENQGIQIP